jgi:hypothetical protein
MRIQIPYKYEPREYQLPLFEAFDEGIKRGLICWHRRAGKDLTLLNVLLKGAIRRVGTYYYLFPTYAQGKKILWKGMTKEGRRFLDYIPKQLIKTKNETEMLIELVNGSFIQVVGTDKIDSVVGTNPVGCVFSEYSLQNPKAWAFIRPILAENGGWAIFNFTPRGKNHAYDLYEMAKDNDKWFCSILTADDTKKPDGTPVITPDIIQEERDSGMSEDMVLQEFYCSFEASINGAYYARQIKFLEENNRILENIYDENLKVHTAWDLGVSDSTSIWFFQLFNGEVRIIDHYENSGEGLPHYIDYLWTKPYKYGSHIAPHDIKVREFSTGQARIDVARKHGLNFLVCPNIGVQDGIESARRTLIKSYFDKKLTKEGLNCLKSYRKEYDEKKLVFKAKPVHDWSSHTADAFRYLSVGLKLIDRQTTSTVVSM